MNDLDETSTRVLRIAQELKTRTCKDEGGIADINSIVVLQQGDRYLCVQSQLDGHPIDNLPEHLGIIARQGVPEFDSISFVIDTFYKKGRKQSDGSYIKEEKPEGSYAKEYAENPDSEIKQALCVLTYTQDGQTKGGSIAYHYDDHGQPVYYEMKSDEPNEPNETDEAPIFVSPKIDFVMTKFIKWCKEKQAELN